MTTVNKDRDGLKELFKGIGVEVGVADGDFAEAILRDNSNVEKFYGIDPYRPHKGYMDYTRGTTFNNMYKHARAKLDRFGKRHWFKSQFSMDAVDNFKDNSLDFVYIDANHSYETCLEDITEWSKKVKPGGIVCGDDYTLPDKPNNGVVRAVSEYVREHKLELTLYVKGEITQWMFIK